MCYVKFTRRCMDWQVVVVQVRAIMFRLSVNCLHHIPHSNSTRVNIHVKDPKHHGNMDNHHYSQKDIIHIQLNWFFYSPVRPRLSLFDKNETHGQMGPKILHHRSDSYPAMYLEYFLNISWIFRELFPYSISLLWSTFLAFAFAFF